MASSSLTGRLLVAAPTMLDPNFARAVVLLLEHNAQGALGVVLNRESETPVEELLPGWGARAAQPDVVYLGGPVSVGTAVCLARPGRRVPDPAVSLLDGAVATVDLSGDPDALPDDVALRLFAGYAGWGLRQLEAEIEEGAWIVADALPGDIVSGVPGRLWEDVLRRQGLPTALLATMPVDPSLN